MPDRDDFEPRDRSFGPAVQAAVERAAAGHSTDPRWDAAAGGLPESHSMILDCRCEYCARLRAMRATLTEPLTAQTNPTAGLRSDTCHAGEPGIASEASTVIPPPRLGLSAEQTEKLADTLEALVAFLRRPRQ